MKCLLLLMLSLLFTAQAWTQDNCVLLRQSAQSSAKSINIVFINSGFNSDLDEFETIVRRTWKTIEDTFVPYSNNVKILTVKLAKLPHEGSTFCQVDPKYGLVCDYNKARDLGSKCLPDSGKPIIVTVHNSSGVWLRGTTSGNLISLSTSPRLPFSLAHEFGHAIFDLADEYEFGGEADKANCSPLGEKCSAWQDLIDAGLATCEAGCKTNSAMINGNFVMKSTDSHSYGHADQRLICCKYKKITGSYPSFCEEYRHLGPGLDRVCR